MRVLLADSQKQVRSALQALLKLQPGVSVVGEAGEATGLVAQLYQTRPDLVLLDWGLPGLSAIGSVSALRQNHPSLLIIVLSGWPEVGQEALAAGADAFVSKVEPPERLLATLYAINARDGKVGVPVSKTIRIG